MPLGQAPFGSRQPPPDEPPRQPGDPRARGDGHVRLGRSVFFVGGALLLALLAVRGRGDGQGAPGPATCLTDRACAQGARCYAVPKDDPFAVEGECAQACEGDLQCPAHFRCEVAAVSEGRQVVPLGARGATAERVGVCRACGEDGCRPQ